MTSPKISHQLTPDRIVVGPSYYLNSGIIHSRTHFDRLRKSGRLTPLFYIGSRLGQWKEIADADLARLIEYGGGEDDAA
jgi:hypothetical protein